MKFKRIRKVNANEWIYELDGHELHFHRTYPSFYSVYRMPWNKYGEEIFKGSYGDYNSFLKAFKERFNLTKTKEK